VRVQHGGGIGQEGLGPPAARAFVSIAGALLVMAALLVLAVEKWHGWHLGLFVWGLGLMLAQMIYAIASARVALRFYPNAGEQRRALVRSRLRVSLVEVTIMGLGVAIAAAGTGWVAIDAGLTAIFVLTGGLSTFVGVREIRRKSRDDG
jgi:hypothetical protein